MKVVITLIAAFVALRGVDGNGKISDSCKLTDINGGAYNFFGHAVAISKDVVVVGNYLDDANGRDAGSIHIYRMNGSACEQNTKITPTDGQVRDNFGYSIALNTEYIIVGSRFDNEPNKNFSQGSAYIYNYNGSAWVYDKIVADDGASGDNFGSSVGINQNNVAVVGIDSGDVYIFAHNGTQWLQKQKLLYAADGTIGHSVAITNIHIAVGAHGQNYNNVRRSGSVFIYKNNSTTWGLQTTISSPNPQFYGWFGRSVSLSGGRVVIGACGEDRFTGKAYVYASSGNTWGLEAILTASDRKDLDWFGWSVAIHQHTIVIGARESDDKGSASGSAYVFELIGGSWTEIAKLLANDGKANARFGWSVGIFNGKVVVGSPEDDSIGKDTGAAYIYNGLNFSTITSTSQATNPQVD